MDMITWALQHQSQWRRESLTSDVTIIASEGTFTGIKATKIDPQSNVNAQGVRTPSQLVLFMFHAADIRGKFKISRGIRIVHKDGIYEVVIQAGTKEYYDDPNQITLNLHAKIVADNS